VCVEPTAHVKVAGVVTDVPSTSKYSGPSKFEVTVIDACAEGDAEEYGVGVAVGEGEPVSLNIPDKPTYVPIETRTIAVKMIIMEIFLFTICTYRYV
jgi:hypothetical protein